MEKFQSAEYYPRLRPRVLFIDRNLKSSLKDLFVNCIVINQPRLPLVTCMFHHYCVSFQDVSERAGRIYITSDYRSIM